jgi:hypothetical protein
MPRILSPRAYLPGGLVLCAFPAIALLLIQLKQISLPMPWPILFALFFLHGIRVVIWCLFKLDFDGAVSWVVDALGSAGFAAFAFGFAAYVKEGWSGGLPFIPDSWNQMFARVLTACGGLLSALIAVRCLRKAFNQYLNKPDDGIWHT